MKLNFKNALVALCLSVGISSAYAKVTLPTFFTDNMVLQQKATVPFFGTSTAGSVKVTTSWDKKEYKATTASGKWEVLLSTPVYGGPYTITIDDGTKTVLKNILIGEVWLCSGQSNMEMPLEGWGKINNYAQEIKNADYPQIRLLQAEHVNNEKPQEAIALQHGGWQVCSPATIADFSSTAYFFARKIYKEKHIPIGLIHSSWGGTVIEAWISAEALSKIKDFTEDLEVLKDADAKKAMEAKYNAQLSQWNAALAAKEEGMKDNKALWADTAYNDAAWGEVPVPSFYEKNVLPGFDGTVWYRKTFTLDKAKKQDGTLELSVDDDDIVWVNGVKIGETKGYNLKRTYKVPASVLKAGKNIITVHVFDSGGDGGIYGPDDIKISFGGKDDISLVGNWKYKVGVSNKDLPATPRLPQGPNRPTVLYNAMIYPIQKYKIAGAIWYQGESNAERAKQYQRLFPIMINDWRKQFGNEKLPFYFVQLANYKQVKDQPAPSDWAELREAQYKTLNLPFTGMAVITDIGDANDIHPKNKQEVGERLALIALAQTYGTKVAYSGPLYKSFKKEGKTISIDFLHTEGMTAKDGNLRGFEIAGADKVFHWADAKIEGNHIVVSSSLVPNPEAVRYNWADNPQGNLVNQSGLPASSFRTDTWPGLTDNNK